MTDHKDELNNPEPVFPDDIQDTAMLEHMADLNVHMREHGQDLPPKSEERLYGDLGQMDETFHAKRLAGLAGETSDTQSMEDQAKRDLLRAYKEQDAAASAAENPSDPINKLELPPVQRAEGHLKLHDTAFTNAEIRHIIHTADQRPPSRLQRFISRLNRRHS